MEAMIWKLCGNCFIFSQWNTIISLKKVPFLVLVLKIYDFLN